MKHTPLHLKFVRPAVCAAALICLAPANAQTERVQSGLQQAGSAVATGAASEAKPEDAAAATAEESALLGGALPGGAVISAAVSSVSSSAGPGGAASAAYATTGRITLTPVSGGESIVATIDEQGLFALAGLKPGRYQLTLTSPPVSGKAKQTQGSSFGEKVNAGMASAARQKTDPTPGRRSVNLTVARHTMTVEQDGAPIEVRVGKDGRFEGSARPNSQDSPLPPN